MIINLTKAYRQTLIAAITGTAIAILCVSGCSRHHAATKQQSSDTLAACGPKALSAVITYYRLNVSWDSLSTVCHTSARGTSLLDLANAAKYLGFDAVGMKTNYDELVKLPKPTIVFINENHYATLLWAGADSVLLDDGGVKNFVKREQFQKQWGGVALALYPTRELQKRIYGKPGK